MIRNLTIERFKSLVKLDIELGRINVFVGANGGRRQKQFAGSRRRAGRGGVWSGG